MADSLISFNVLIMLRPAKQPSANYCSVESELLCGIRWVITG